MRSCQRSAPGGKFSVFFLRRNGQARKQFNRAFSFAGGWRGSDGYGYCISRTVEEHGDVVLTKTIHSQPPGSAIYRLQA